MADWWLTNDRYAYSLWATEPSRDDWGVWGAEELQDVNDPGWSGILPYLCPRDDRPYLLEVGGREWWIAADDDGYALFSARPESVGILRRQWDGPVVATGDDILGALVDDGGCVRVSVREVG